MKKSQPLLLLILTVGIMLMTNMQSVMAQTQPNWRTDLVDCSRGCLVRTGPNQALYIYIYDTGELFIVSSDGTPPIRHELADILTYYPQMSPVDFVVVQNGQAIVFYAYPEAFMTRIDLATRTQTTINLPDQRWITSCDPTYNLIVSGWRLMSRLGTGDNLLVCDSSRNLYIIDASSSTIIRTIPIDNGGLSFEFYPWNSVIGGQDGMIYIESPVQTLPFVQALIPNANQMGQSGTTLVFRFDPSTDVWSYVRISAFPDAPGVMPSTNSSVARAQLRAIDTFSNMYFHALYSGQAILTRIDWQGQSYGAIATEQGEGSFLFNDLLDDGRVVVQTIESIRAEVVPDIAFTPTLTPTNTPTSTPSLLTGLPGMSVTHNLD
jgi:hypothetical protein